MNRNVRWRTLGLTPTACRQRRRSWLAERARWVASVSMLTGCQGISAFTASRTSGSRRTALRKPCRRWACKAMSARWGAPGPGHRLLEAVHRTSPQLRQAQALVHQVVEHRRKGRRGPWLEPHTHDGGVRRNDFNLRTGQRTNQLGMATDRKVDLEPARGQVALHVRRLTGALDPDCPHHPRQSRYRRTLNVRLHYGHPAGQLSSGKKTWPACRVSVYSRTETILPSRTANRPMFRFR